jgi:hypothetical protein
VVWVGCEIVRRGKPWKGFCEFVLDGLVGLGPTLLLLGRLVGLASNCLKLFDYLLRFSVCILLSLALSREGRGDARIKSGVSTPLECSF